MKFLYYLGLAGAVACGALAHALSSNESVVDNQADRVRLLGAWHLVRIDAPGLDGKLVSMPQPGGDADLHTRWPHVGAADVPKNVNTQSTEYVQDGYEASFGSYDVDESTHTVTYHVMGSITRSLLVGKDLPRVYQLTGDGRLVIKSVRADEHWSVTWEHY